MLLDSSNNHDCTMAVDSQASFGLLALARAEGRRLFHFNIQVEYKRNAGKLITYMMPVKLDRSTHDA